MAIHGTTVKPRVKLYLSNDELEGVFGDGKWRLLDAVRREGTLVSAARSLGRSYRKAWGDIRLAERGLGWKLVEPSRGGFRKGQTVLTPAAEALLDAWSAYRSDLVKAMSISFERHLASLMKNETAAFPAPEEKEQVG